MANPRVIAEIPQPKYGEQYSVGDLAGGLEFWYKKRQNSEWKKWSEGTPLTVMGVKNTTSSPLGVFYKHIPYGTQCP
jgi:hypothetical protein